MALESLCVFLVVRRTDSSGSSSSVQYRFQNGVIGNSVTTGLIEGGNRTYEYLPFIYQGGTLNRTGDNITAGLGLAPNEISLNIATEMTQTVNFDTNGEVTPMTVEAVVMLMDDNFEPNRIISNEIWVAAGMSYTVDELEIVLSSAIDAVNALAPNYSLDRKNIGSLPVSNRVNL
jgi:hypothetical protein